MLLSDRRIKRYHNEGLITISPYDEMNLGTNSYDARLGNNFWFPNPDLPVDFILDPYSEDSVRSYWSRLINLEHCSERSIVIPPQTTVLGHTLERIGGRQKITTSMRARSSMGRLAIAPVKCAGVGDVNYVSWWTLEITNLANVPVKLYYGMRIVQAEFFKVGRTITKYHGKYGRENRGSTGATLGNAVFDPDDMLPKLWLDREAKRLT